MALAPLIGITARRVRAADLYPQDATLLGDETAVVHFGALARHVRDAGGVPFLLPFTAVDAEALVERLDGLILSGGEDVETPRARGRRGSGHSPARDAAELALLEAARAAALPVLGVLPRDAAAQRGARRHARRRPRPPRSPPCAVRGSGPHDRLRGRHTGRGALRVRGRGQQRPPAGGRLARRRPDRGRARARRARRGARARRRGAARRPVASRVSPDAGPGLCGGRRGAGRRRGAWTPSAYRSGRAPQRGRELAGRCRARPRWRCAELEDPNDGRALGPARASDPARVEAALAGAAASGWPRLGLEERAGCARAIRRCTRCACRRDRGAEAIDTGVPISVTGASPDRSATSCAARSPRRGGGRRRRCPPTGAGSSCCAGRGDPPRCSPLERPGPGLGVEGRPRARRRLPAILKPSEHAPQAGGHIARAAAAAEFPAGTLAVVHGGPDVALGLAGDARIAVVSLTGGLAAGRAVAAAAVPRMAALQLELGSVEPGDRLRGRGRRGRGGAGGRRDEAQRPVVRGAAPDVRRRARHDELLDALRAELGRVRVGSSLDRRARWARLPAAPTATTCSPRSARLGGDALATADVRREAPSSRR